MEQTRTHYDRRTPNTPEQVTQHRLHEAHAAVQEQRFLEAPEYKAAQDESPEAVEDLLLSDADTFADWLAGECAGSGFQRYVLGRTLDPVWCTIKCDHATVPQLVTYMLSVYSELQKAACKELRERFLKAQGVVA